MLVVIFGAGASYDSRREDPPPAEGSRGGDRPPLAKHLFDPAFRPSLDKYPQATGLVSILYDAVTHGEGVEEKLEALLDEAGTTDNYRHVELLAIRFYLQHAINKTASDWARESFRVTNYAELMTRTRNWQKRSGEPVRLITFNYDRLLDEACANTLGMDVQSMDGYIEREDFKLYKVHGSTNWAQVIKNPIDMTSNPLERILELGAAIDPVLDGFVVTEPGNVSVGYPPGGEAKPAVPAIALPLATKSGFVCPPGHVQQMQADLANAERAVIIGWRGADAHFNLAWRDALDGKSPELHIVGKDQDSAREVGEGISAAIRAEAFSPSRAGGFSGLLGGDILGGLLAQ